MKKITITALGAILILSMAGCQKITTEGVTRTTYYPVITLEGGTVILASGSSYVEPGYSATLNGEDVTSQVEVNNNIDNTTPGQYKVNYSAVNSDGFSATSSRDVIIVGSGFENFYYSEVRNTSGSRHYYNAPITIKHLEGNQYQISDLLGGLYFYGIYPGYEPTYDFHAESIIELNPDNTIKLIKEGNWYFYDPDDPLTIQVGVFDPAKKSVHLEVGFSGATSYLIDLVSPSVN